ncbi:MAG: D-alanine--D-alanine ligase [Flammeovirgaceae bacterium]|jgi:D-alanine-D-alanine ligase|nr:D-alanine--D-alanine ligase [Flammeovirgaceae bacterium]|tara:strand:+ start:18129 stop:19199 length:1071 start_codon:yes stop_codon:yes gene_type:complete
MVKKEHLIILFGGRSVEHEISIKSAINVVTHLDKDRFKVSTIGIAKSGDWFLVDDINQPIVSGVPIVLSLSVKKPSFRSLGSEIDTPIEIVFPILHGTDGEDGSIQGLFQALNVVVIGSNVLGSAISMDKIIAKKLLEHAGIPVVPYLCFSKQDKLSFQDISITLGLPFIVKAGNLGSSVGISKVSSEETFHAALQDSFQYGNEILIESFVKCRELECGILGNEQLASTWPGEITLIKNYDFYTYEAKYLDKEAIRIDIPAKVAVPVQLTIRELCEKVFKVLKCNDFARVDVFLTDDNKIMINEINSIPGFTDVSMFPGLWAHMGLTYPELITKVINLGIERWQKEQQYATDYEKH